jgi:hypothetical protein
MICSTGYSAPFGATPADVSKQAKLYGPETLGGFSTRDTRALPSQGNIRVDTLGNREILSPNGNRTLLDPQGNLLSFEGSLPSQGILAIRAEKNARGEFDVRSDTVAGPVLARVAPLENGLFNVSANLNGQNLSFIASLENNGDISLTDPVTQKTLTFSSSDLSSTAQTMGDIHLLIIPIIVVVVVASILLLVGTTK